MTVPVADLTPAELADRLARADPLTLLDVREPRERAFCRIPAPDSAVDLHVPMQWIPERIAAIRDSAAGRGLVVYCHHGVRSEQVAHWLAERLPGPVYNLVGGVDAWSLVVDPRVPRYG